MEEVWDILKTHIHKTLKLNSWNDKDLTTNINEMKNLQDWNITTIPIYIGKAMKNPIRVISPTRIDPYLPPNGPSPPLVLSN